MLGTSAPKGFGLACTSWRVITRDAEAAPRVARWLGAILRGRSPTAEVMRKLEPSTFR